MGVLQGKSGEPVPKNVSYSGESGGNFRILKWKVVRLANEDKELLNWLKQSHGGVE